MDSDTVDIERKVGPSVENTPTSCDALYEKRTEGRDDRVKGNHSFIKSNYCFVSREECKKKPTRQRPWLNVDLKASDHFIHVKDRDKERPNA